MKVPFIDITRFEPEFLSCWAEKVQSMSAGAQFMAGPELAKLESALVERLGVAHAVGCANGTDALQLALRALGVGPGDAVLVPNATFWATFEAIVNVGGKPVTVDVSPDDGGVDFAAFEQALHDARPKAAIIVHLYGWGPSRLADLRVLCRQHDVPLLEDGAQCFGALYQARPIFAGALISTTSFYPAKVLGAAGDGGAVFTDDKALAARVRMLANHGRTAHYGYGEVGWNSRLDALQAAFLNLGLDHIDARVASRRESAELYYALLPAVGLAPMAPPPDYVENGYCNVCIVPDPGRKVAIEAALKDAGVGFGNIYPGTMSSQIGAKPYAGRHFGGDNADRLCRQVLNLPLFPYMTRAEIDYVVSVVQSVGV